MKKGMIKVSVLYPNGEGKSFDMDYYCNTHVPMVGGLLGDAVKGATVEKGLGGGAPDYEDISSCRKYRNHYQRYAIGKSRVWS